VILVTGASGHLGGAVLRRLRSEGREVRAFVRDADRAGDLASLGASLAVGDVLDPASLERACTGCKSLVHCAAGFLMWSRDVERDIIRPSVDGTKHALEAAAAKGLERVVYVSSSATIAAAKSPAIEVDETQTLDKAHTPYVQGKIAAERWAIDFAKRAPLPIIVVNPGLILGPGFSKPSESVKVVADVVIRGQPFAFPGSWPITDVDDVASSIVSALSAGRSGERYLLAGEQMHIVDMLKLVAALCSLPPPRQIPLSVVRTFAALAGAWGRMTGRRPMVDGAQVAEWGGLYQNMPSRKARAELGFDPRPARATIVRTIAWLIARGFVPEARRRLLRLDPDVESELISADRRTSGVDRRQIRSDR
jgi:dihydroflavonol-4-reductase